MGWVLGGGRILDPGLMWLRCKRGSLYALPIPIRYLSRIGLGMSQKQLVAYKEALRIDRRCGCRQLSVYELRMMCSLISGSSLIFRAS